MRINPHRNQLVLIDGLWRFLSDNIMNSGEIRIWWCVKRRIIINYDDMRGMFHSNTHDIHRSKQHRSLHSRLIMIWGENQGIDWWSMHRRNPKNLSSAIQNLQEKPLGSIETTPSSGHPENPPAFLPLSIEIMLHGLSWSLNSSIS